MALSLGLENIQSAQPDKIYTVSDVLEAELECMDAQQALTDYINFNEILFSVRKHASQECVAFASDLLGIDSVSLEAEANGDGAEAKKGFGEKVKNAWNKLLELIKRFWGWLKGAIAKIFKASAKNSNNNEQSGQSTDSKGSASKTVKLVSKAGMARMASQSNALQYEKTNIRAIEEKIQNYSALVDKELTNKADYNDAATIKTHCHLIEQIYGNIYVTATHIDAIFKANGPGTNRKTANQASVIAGVNKLFNALNRKVIKFIREELSDIYRSSFSFFGPTDDRARQSKETEKYVNQKEKDINDLSVNKK